MGGGTLARRLIAANLKVLLLERGGLNWSTHVLNTSRPHADLINPSKSIENDPTQDNDYLFKQFKENYETDEREVGYQGGPVFCLGGRSAVWGLYCPKLSEEDEKFFPPDIVDQLNSKYYREADEILTSGEFEKPKGLYKIIPILGEEVEPAYIGAQFRPSKHTSYTIPLGAYSTIDFLMDYEYNVRKQNASLGTKRHKTSHVLLHMQAIRFILDSDKSSENSRVIKCVVAQDTISGQKYYFTGHSFVLAAGTVESYRIANQSNITQSNSGITDHAILYHYFVSQHKTLKEENVEPAPVFPNRAYKLQKYRKLPSGKICLINVAINCDVFLGRGGKEWNKALKTMSKGDHSTVNALSAVVFEFTAPLNENNKVYLNGEKTRISMRDQDIADEDMQDLHEFAKKLVAKIGKPLPGFNHGDFELKRAALGCVAHEAGTLPIKGKLTPNGIVNSNLQFIGYDNLFGCDLSVFPVCPSANPSKTLIGLALRLGDHIIQSNKPSSKL